MIAINYIDMEPESYFDYECGLFEDEDVQGEQPEFDFDFDFEIGLETGVTKRYHAPIETRRYADRFIVYDNAAKLAKQIDISKSDFSYFAYVTGNFIFGDFIEALAVEKDLKYKNITLSTLSLSENNVDSFANLIKWGLCDELNIVLSTYFWGHERHNLIPYMYKELDLDNKFQLAFARIHTKITLLTTSEGRKFIMYGSANLRSSDNLEFVVIQENNALFDHNMDVHEALLKEFSTINKPINKSKTWQLAQETTAEAKQEKQEQAKAARLSSEPSLKKSKMKLPDNV